MFYFAIRIMQMRHAKMLLINCFLDCLLSFSCVNQFWFIITDWPFLEINHYDIGNHEKYEVGQIVVW